MEKVLIFVGCAAVLGIIIQIAYKKFWKKD